MQEDMKWILFVKLYLMLYDSKLYLTVVIEFVVYQQPSIRDWSQILVLVVSDSCDHVPIREYDDEQCIRHVAALDEHHLRDVYKKYIWEVMEENKVH